MTEKQIFPKSNFVRNFLDKSSEIAKAINEKNIDQMVTLIKKTKSEHGRVFFAGSGGGAGHSSHAAADFRKILEIESYSITDNVSELTARINDESWEDAYKNWLKISRVNDKDILFIFSVGGGDLKEKISVNLIRAIDYVKNCGGKVIGIAGRNGGYLNHHADASVIVPNLDPNFVTAQTEGFQAIIWHLIVCNPLLNGNPPKWEGLEAEDDLR